MKTTLIIIMLFTFVLPCFGQLTANDVRQIIREELDPVKKEIEFIKKDLGLVKIEIATMKGDIKAFDGKLSLLQWFTGGLVAIIVFAIGLPLLLMTYRERKENKLSKEIIELKKRIIELEKGKIITS